MSRLKIGMLGAGAIGCWLGGELSAAGYDVVLVGRDWLGRRHGIPTPVNDDLVKRIRAAEAAMPEPPPRASS